MTIEFSAKYWREAKAFGERKDRMALVRIEPCPTGGALIIATDGVQMVIFSDESGKCSEPITVPYREIEDCADSHRIRVAPNVLFLVRDDAIIGGAVYPTKDYAFPEWRAVLPALPDALTYFDPARLKECTLNAKAVAIATAGIRAMVFPSGRTDAVTMVAAMNAEEKPDDWSWLFAPKPAEPKATPQPRTARRRKRTVGGD